METQATLKGTKSPVIVELPKSKPRTSHGDGEPRDDRYAPSHRQIDRQVDVHPRSPR